MAGAYGRIMKRFITWMVCVGVLLLTGCARRPPPTAAPTVQTQGDLRAALATEPSPPHTGDDTLIITLANPTTNQPIGDANLTALTVSQSPRLPGVPTTGRAQGNGVYNIPVRFAIASAYRVELTVQRVGRAPVTFSFPLDVPQ